MTRFVLILIEWVWNSVGFILHTDEFDLRMTDSLLKGCAAYFFLGGMGLLLPFFISWGFGFCKVCLKYWNLEFGF